jgi:hypothetical protein
MTSLHCKACTYTRPNKNKECEHTSMSLVGFEHRVSVFHLLKTVRPLNCAATVIGRMIVPLGNYEHFLHRRTNKNCYVAAQMRVENRLWKLQGVLISPSSNIMFRKDAILEHKSDKWTCFMWIFMVFFGFSLIRIMTRKPKSTVGICLGDNVTANQGRRYYVWL